MIHPTERKERELGIIGAMLRLDGSRRRARRPAVALALLAWTAVSCAPRPRPTDVLIVGSGISGLSAALEAARGGATVRVVEMSSVFGGHAVMAHGGLAIVDTPIQADAGIADSTELAERDFLDWGEDASAGWVALYVRRSNELILEWTRDLGVDYSSTVLQLPGNSVPRFHSPIGRGLGLVSPIYRAALAEPRVTFEWNLRVDNLLIEDGRVVGVEGEMLRHGARQEFRAAHVVLATGGFQSNLDMVREFWPETFDFPGRLLVGSGVNSVGIGHRVAQEAGAQLLHMDRQWNYATGLPDPRYPEGRRGLNSHNAASIWVNSAGDRFVNETASTKERLRAVLRQDGARYWGVFDERGKRRLFVSGTHWNDFDTVERLILSNPEITARADTLAELGASIGLPPGKLDATVDRYNRMLAAGRDDDFRRFGFGGVPYDLAPGFEEGPIPIERPPFYALTFYPLARKSMGGVAIDLETRALDAQGAPIPGLYAVGELAGFGGINGWAGLEGTFLGPSIVTGRIAGRTILDEVGTLPAPASSVRRPASRPAAAEFGNDACFGCHYLPTLVTAERPGYDHFERAHAEVLARDLSCRTCHAEMYPYRGSTHFVDPVAQIDTCARCHLAREH